MVCESHKDYVNITIMRFVVDRDRSVANQFACKLETFNGATFALLEIVSVIFGKEKGPAVNTTLAPTLLRFETSFLNN